MAFAAKILADSLSPDGVRLTTFCISFPRIILAEFNTHRVFSRNSASSRAIPVEKMIKMVETDPYIPTHWGKNQKGMQADAELSSKDQIVARNLWTGARSMAIHQAKDLMELGVHKQITNRLLEPFMWHTVIVTATEWSNFWHLRNNPMAHPEIQRIARMMQELYETQRPFQLAYGEWHLPLVQEDELSNSLYDSTQGGRERWVKISSARCGRVSYLTHDGKRDVEEDLALYDRLLGPGHLSPFEHPARPATKEDISTAMFDMKKTGNTLEPADFWFGNLRGWVQHRKQIPNEHDILGAK